jgi:steroid delta-isomerase-like uncharacterized protein
MSAEENKALVRRFYDEFVSQGKLEVADEIVAADFTRHRPGAEPGREGLKQYIAADRATFPDMVVTPEEVLAAEGGRVVVRFTASGTHSGADFQGFPASGRRATVAGIAIFRVADGKLAELWQQADGVALRRQLGLLSDSGQAAG